VDGYRRWVRGKVRQLEQMHPELREAPRLRRPRRFGASVAHLDISAVVKASQAISGEIVLGASSKP